MRLPKLLNADFEQSLNLLDDSLVDSYKAWWDEKPKWGRKAKIIAYLVIFFIIWLCSEMSTYFYNNPGEYTVETNLFPPWLCWVIITVLLVISFGQVYGMGQNWECMGFYNAQVFSFWYCLGILLAFNLLAATALTPMVTIYGTVGGCAVAVMLLIKICRNQIREITSELYGIKVEQDYKKTWLGKVLKFQVLAKAGAVVVAGYYIYKFIFVSFESVVTAPLVIGGTIMMNIIIVFIVFYMLFPSVIQGYYRNKYAEEYRDWEGKTQIEWYGEKYFNKYIKGTEKEKKE